MLEPHVTPEIEGILEINVFGISKRK